MKNVTVNICPVCGCGNHKPVFECKDYFALGETFMIKQCDACGFRFTDNFPDEEEIGRYYKADDYVSHTDTQAGLINKIYHFARSIMLKQKGRLAEGIYKENGVDVNGEDKNLLDIGCGTGYFLNEMKSRGWKVKGVEKSADAREVAEKNFGIELADDISVLSSDVSNKQRFDIITLWHVLEHLHDVNGALKNIREMLKDEGTLILALPNSSSFDADKYREYWAAYDVPRHLWHFTPDTISRLAVKNGFIITKYSAMPLDTFYVSMLSEKYKGNSVPFVRGMFTGLQGLLKITGSPDAASSIIYILKKKI